MYDSFYGLTEKPFQISTDPRFLWFGEQHREALANLKYGVLDRNGFIVLTGDVGTGKTTLVNALLGSFDERVIVVKVNHPSLEIHEFMALVAQTLDPEVSITDKPNLLLFFNAYLQHAHAQGKIVLLIIDEAQHLSMDLMEEIRLLSNIEHEGEKLLSIIFVGQNEFKPMLMAPQCRALYQRITSFYNIVALTEEETRHYVTHRLKVSGSFAKLFTSAALRKIHHLSRGIPRIINVLCDRALLTGYVNNRRVFGADIITECARELDIGAQRNWMHRLDEVGGTIAQYRNLLTKVPKYAADLRNALGKVLKEINGSWHRVAARRRPEAQSALQALRDTTTPFLKKYRQKAHPYVLPVGLAAISLAVIFGVYAGYEGKNETSVDANLLKKTPSNGVATATNEPALPSDSWGNSQFGRSLTEISSSSLPPETMLPASPPGESPMPMVAKSASAALGLPVEPKLTYVEEAKSALDQGDYRKALELLESYPVGSANEDVEAVGLYANALVGRAGEIMPAAPSEAEALLLKAIEVAPNMATPHIILGKQYTRLKDYPRATKAYRKAVQIDPTASDAHFNLGFIYARSGDYQKAETAFSRVVQLRPSYLGKSLFNLAVVQQKLGKNDESIANLEEVITMGPENKKALAYLEQLRNSSTLANSE